MLLRSVEEADLRDVHMAPTVFLDGKQLDSAEDLTVKAICDAYKGPKPKACDNVEVMRSGAQPLLPIETCEA